MQEAADVRIRSARHSDLDDVARVWHESASHMAGANPDMPSRFELRDRIDAELLSGWDLYVAMLGGEIVGLLAIKPAEAVLDQIFVLPARQGSGVGSALLHHARQKMPAGFTLRMASSNDLARRFYEKEGLTFLRDGHHPRTGDPVRYYGWHPRQESTGAR